MPKKTVRAASVRANRDAEKRVMQTVHEEHDEPWLRGASLEMPPARPGMAQRWIRVSIGGKDDQTNWARKQREGWKPRKAESVPDDFPVPRIDQGRHAGLIGIEGMILCERPMAISERRDRHFKKETQRRTDAIKADLEKTNRENTNPAFGPIQMASRAVPVREVSREVAVQDD